MMATKERRTASTPRRRRGSRPDRSTRRSRCRECHRPRTAGAVPAPSPAGDSAARRARRRACLPSFRPSNPPGVIACSKPTTEGRRRTFRHPAPAGQFGALLDAQQHLAGHQRDDRTHQLGADAGHDAGRASGLCGAAAGQQPTALGRHRDDGEGPGRIPGMLRRLLPQHQGSGRVDQRNANMSSRWLSPWYHPYLVTTARCASPGGSGWCCGCPVRTGFPAIRSCTCRRGPDRSAPANSRRCRLGPRR